MFKAVRIAIPAEAGIQEKREINWIPVFQE
jgi:hypothetical protein